jgi:hypothetical protein
VKKRKSVVISLLCLVLGTSGCGRDSETSDLRFAPDSNDPVVTVASTTQIERLNEVLPATLMITRAYAVRAEADSFGHFVAAKLRDPASGKWDGDRIAIWYMHAGMDQPGDAYAVDSEAQAFGTLPPFPGVEEANPLASPDVSALVALTRRRP